jgi:hypothetical protein
MKAKNLNLWEISKHSFKMNDNITSVLSNRAGVKTSHYNMLYSSRVKSIDRQTSSPGVSAIFQNNRSTVK